MHQFITPRCCLRLFTQQDTEALIPILGCPKVMQYSMTGVMSLPAIITAIEQWTKLNKTHGVSPFAVIYEEQLIGYAGLDIRNIEGIEQVQLTFRLAEKYWGKGLASELANAIKAHAFGDLGLSEMIAITDPKNHASIRILVKIGMKFSKEITYGGLRLNLYKITV
jgi:ribosomal-protein-alanine N-acetyltransferase